MIAFAVALVWGGLVLTVQALNEWRVLGGEIQTVPMLSKALWRFGLRPQQWYTGNEALLTWPAYLEQQVNRMALMLIPFAYGFALRIREIIVGGTLLFVLGVITFRRQLSLFVLALLFLSYTLWAVLMKQFVSVHDFQSLFMVSIAIAFFSVLVLYIRPAVAPIVAVVTCALFVLTVYRTNQIKNELVPVVNPITAQFQNIYEQLPRGSKLFVCGQRDTMGGGHHALDFYLAGSISTVGVHDADYIIVHGDRSVSGAERLTDNPDINLFQPETGTSFTAGACDGLSP